MDANKIFDAVIAASGMMAREYAIQEKKQHIIDISKKECGNCWHWMKSTCKPEKEKGIFKSMSGCPCKDFVWTSSTVELVKKLEKELEEFLNKK